MIVATPEMIEQLELDNFLSSKKVTKPYGPVVCVATLGNGPRLNTVWLALESIAQGTVRPSRLILWIDEADKTRGLSDHLFRLKKRGLEIAMCEKRYGPHCKYYPYVSTADRLNVPMVTADDDTVYPSDWLEKLVEANGRHLNDVICYRARVLRFNGTSLDCHYENWETCKSDEPSFSHFVTGGPGVIYPPSFLNYLRDAGSGFFSQCFYNDDIWLHIQAVKAGFKIRQLTKEPTLFPTIPETQKVALWIENSAGRNDQMIAAVYGSNPDVVLKIRSETDQVPVKLKNANDSAEK
jgi:hypothetical protein